MFHSRLIGSLFLAGFLSYGLGSGLISSVVGAPIDLSGVLAHRTTLALGAFLMLVNTVVDVAKGVVFFPILERYGRPTALAYLATMIVEVVLLTVGVLALLMIGPVARQAVDAGQLGTSWAGTLGPLAVQSNALAYQVAEMMLGIGCVLLCALLFRSRLIPRPLALMGLIGYPILVAGSTAELFEIRIGLVLTIPGGLFELALAVWLLIRGFDAKVYSRVGDGRDVTTDAQPATP
jgi:Domain of unknown function (DUF4386)